MEILTYREKVIGAYVGAAVGDALGWPFEDRSHRIKSRDLRADNGFLNWTRREGWMSQSYELPILAGEYSDDTQLILATSRSLCFDSWWEHLAFVELPTWLLYERGGGGAVKRAAKSWSFGKAPWSSPPLRDAFWSAGGNGVCMRILPHVVRPRSELRLISDEVVANGLLTHGHPRALISGVVYALAIFHCLHQTSTLEFGGLINVLIEDFDLWSEMPMRAFATGNMLDTHPTGVVGYKRLWGEVAEEMLALLRVAARWIDVGGLDTGEGALKEIGAFDRETGGAGTVTACAAIFLSSRYASSPRQGIRTAANMVGTDADTIASMTGGLLGALHGRESFSALGREVQDYKYIVTLADAVLSDHRRSNRSQWEVRRQDLIKFIRNIRSSNVGEVLHFPDGRGITVQSVNPLQSRFAIATEWRMIADDGQTLAITRADKASRSAPTDGFARVWMNIFVSDLDRATFFYSNVLGLRITSQSSEMIEMEGVVKLVLVQPERSLSAGWRNGPCLVIEMPDLKAAHLKLSRAGAATGPINRHEEGILSFFAEDPFGNSIEIRNKGVPG